MWKNPLITLIAGALVGFLGGFVAGQRQPRPPAHAHAVAMPANPHAGVPGAPAAEPNRAPGVPVAPDLLGKLQELEAQLARAPESYELLVRAGHTLYDLGDFVRANEFYERARRLRDDSPDVLTDSGVAYREMDMPEKALELFEKASAMAPAHWQSRFNQVIVRLFDLNDTVGAERILDTLQRMSPKPAGMPDLAPLRKEIAARKTPSAPPHPSE